MAGDWIKMRTRLDTDLKIIGMSKQLGIPIKDVVFGLYKIICWLNDHGKYGKLNERFEGAVDHIFGGPICRELRLVGWLKTENSELFFSGFTLAHTERKSIGAKLRSSVVSGKTCVSCGSAENIEVDHDIPISKGGTSEMENLVPLCRSCNRQKGTKTLKEFLNA